MPYQGGRDVVMLPAATSAPNWTWQDCERPWLVTRWRVSLINELGEIYAIEIGNRSGISGWTEPDEPDRPRRVWLLKSGIQPERETYGFRGRLAWERLQSLMVSLMRQRDSLVLLVGALSKGALESESEELV